MDAVGLIIMLAVGAIAGWLAGQLMKGAGYGLVGNIVIGILGAIVAGFLLPNILPLSGIVGQIISATIGAVILLFAIKVLKRAT